MSSDLKKGNPIRSVIAVLVIMTTTTKNILAAEWREDCELGWVCRGSLHMHTHAQVVWMRRGKVSGSCTVQLSDAVAWTSSGGELDFPKN